MTAPPQPLGSAANDRILPWRSVRDLTGISRTTAWRLQNSGDFPRPVVISPGRVGWRESEVAAWKAALAPRGAAQTLAPGSRNLPAPVRCDKRTIALAATPSHDLEPTPLAPKAAAPRRRRRRESENQITFDF